MGPLERSPEGRLIAASLFGFQRENAYFTADPAAKEAPQVKF